MKIIFFGDSITDMGREYESDGVTGYGVGYVLLAAADIKRKFPKAKILNRGISGNRVVDLYSRVKCHVWNEEPNILSILIGVNDVWHGERNGVEIDRFEKVYRMLLEDTLKVLPKVKIILCQPFFIKGSETLKCYDCFLQVKEYAAVVEKLAKEFSLPFLPLQEVFDEALKKYDGEDIIPDGVHPNELGARLIADAWMDEFLKIVK